MTTPTLLAVVAIVLLSVAAYLTTDRSAKLVSLALALIALALLVVR
jgi:hypothetical protein